MLWGIAAGVVFDRNLAHDIVQDAAAIALTKLQEFHPGTAFVAWMAQIVRYVALNEARRRQRQRAEPDPSATPDLVASANPDPSDPLLNRRLMNALASLDEVARTCLILRTIHAMTYTEISMALSIPEGTAMSHVHRSRQMLRERLGERADDNGGRANK